MTVDAPTFEQRSELEQAELLNHDTLPDRRDALAILQHYERFANEVERDASRIIPGHGAALIRIGASPSSISKHLPGPTVSKYDDSQYYSYHNLGVSVRVDTGKQQVTSVFLYHDGVDGYSGYRGVTPEGISVNSTRGDVELTYGLPTYGSWSGLAGDEYNAYYYNHGLIVLYFSSARAPMQAVIQHIVVMTSPEPARWKMVDDYHALFRRLAPPRSS